MKISQQSLPTLYESSDVCGKLSKEGAEAVGLKVGTPVVAGAGDQAAGAVGMGIVSPWRCQRNHAAHPALFLPQPIVRLLDPQGRLHTFPCDSRALARDGSYASCGVVAALVSRSVRLRQE